MAGGARHATPFDRDPDGCHPVLVCLGSRATRSLLGPQARISELRGHPIEGTAWAGSVIVTLHPSAVLRSREAADDQFARLTADLRLAVRTLEGANT